MKNGLLLGLDGVGKTLLLRQLTLHLSKNHRSVLDKLAALANGVSGIASRVSGGGRALHAGGDDLSESVTSSGVLLPMQRETQPTIGVEHATLNIDTKPYVVCEVGGQLLPMWKAYFSSCDFWIYVLDISNPAQIAGSAIEFFNIMANDDMRKKPKLLLFNKMDEYFTLEDTLLRSYLQLDQLLTSDLDGSLMHVIKISAATGENIDSVIKWFSHRWGTASSSTQHANNAHNTLVSTRSDSRIHPVVHS
uniref:ADP-ribosylation factor-like protein 16 n=1 Tax=Globisporangium ultimum (strain ATCC 200006 / CBS 805.95 / DAOM BR144) TaxID=431595 RepID=K3WW45_GLOUD